MSAVLELVCGQCEHLFMRWDSGEAHNGHAVDSRAVRIEDPGGYHRASDGKWYRWAPGPAADLPDGEVLARYVLACPSGCRGTPQARVDRLQEAAAAALEVMDRTGVPLLRTTVDRLLRYCK